MERGYSVLMREESERAKVDHDEAIVFLAAIIPKEDKERIRIAMENDREFEDKQHFFLGMKVRNALRIGDFFYLPETMDIIWFDWLRKAVNLPQEKIILTDLIKERVRKFRTGTRRSRKRPALEKGKVENIMQQLEKLLDIKMPLVEINHSDNINKGFCVPAAKFPSGLPIEEKERFLDRRKAELKYKGLKDSEIGNIDHSRFNVFLPRRFPHYPAEQYAVVWEELGHVASFALGVRDQQLNGSIAVACRFIGLLETAKEGKLELERAFDQIERDLKTLNAPLSQFSAHPEALYTMGHFNPDLKFRDRDPDELILELTKCIKYAQQVDVKNKSKFETPLILIATLIAIAVFAISVILYH